METGHRLTEAMLVNALAKKLDAAVDAIVSFEVSGGAKKGDNFCCEMKQVDVVATISGEERKFVLMAKCFPMNEFRVKWLKDVSSVI